MSIFSFFKKTKISIVIGQFEIMFGIKKLKQTLKAYKLEKTFKSKYAENIINGKGKKELKLKKNVLGLTMPKKGVLQATKFDIEENKNILSLSIQNPAISSSDNTISYPPVIDNRYFIPKVKDQGDKPYCAGYSSTKFLEQYIWKKTNKKVIYNPEKVYEEAKKVDGLPNVQGTDLVSALQACINLKIIDGDKFEIKTINSGKDALKQIKSIIHKHRAMLMGFDISTEWFRPTLKGNDYIIEEKGGASMGGHAVLCCGYKNGMIEISNSWGENYADKGIVYLSEELFNKCFLYGALLVKKKNI